MGIDVQLKQLRAASGLKVSECARRIGVSQSTYRDWEQGRSISGEPYLKIAQIFNVSLSELFGTRQSELSQKLSELQENLEILVTHVKSIRSKL